MRPMKTLVSLVLTAALLSPSLPVHAAEQSAFNPGDLIKSSSNSAVYYFAQNGKRYVFPNEKTYFTWYSNFSGVKIVSARVLAAVPIGGNVTYRPGRKMLKITTDPKVYVVDQGGFLRHVTTASIAESLYSISWKNQIDDLPDQLFTNYRVGTPITGTSDFTPANVLTQTPTIAHDKQLPAEIANITISDQDTGFVPATITVKRGTKVTWTNRDTVNHTVTGPSAGLASGNLLPTGTYTKTFNTVGSFDYTNSIYPSMEGTINVVP